MIMMISLYRKSVHSLLSLTDSSLSPKSYSNQPHNSKLQQASEEHGLGLGLISDYNNLMQFKSPNILESSSLHTKPVSPPRKHPGRGGFDVVGGGDVDGLMSCTESLGFESSDERLVSDHTVVDGGGCTGVRARRRRVVERKFPPPLFTLNHDGRRSFYLRPVRKDGRLELTEVRIERTETLRACRGDGRLRLHLIKEEKEEEEKIELRRCVEVVNQHQHHHHQQLDVWRQQCLTTS